MGLLLNVGINHPDYSLDVHYELKVSPIDRCYLQKIRFHLILLRFLVMIWSLYNQLHLKK